MDNINKSLKENYRLVANTIRAYPMQLRESWESVNKMLIPEEYRDIDNIILCGMGGSALGARIACSVLFNRLRLPFEIVNDYKLPAYAGPKTLVICSSYSGTTEEPIECTYQAIEKGCKTFGITTGNKLEKIFKENNLPYYLIDETQNPSKQPRMSIGYATGSILGLLNKVEASNVLAEEIDDAIAVMNQTATEFHEHTPSSRNTAKKIYEKVKNRGVILVASEHLLGATHTIKNQFNENAKTFSAIFAIPELNHHLMEGLKIPVKLKDNLIFFFIDSNLYNEKVQKRYKLTQKVIEKNGFEYVVFTPVSAKLLSQAFEVIILGSFLTYFLTEYYQIDPLEIPFVDYFKEQMGQPLGK